MPWIRPWMRIGGNPTSGISFSLRMFESCFTLDLIVSKFLDQLSGPPKRPQWKVGQRGQLSQRSLIQATEIYHKMIFGNLKKDRNVFQDGIYDIDDVLLWIQVYFCPSFLGDTFSIFFPHISYSVSGLPGSIRNPGTQAAALAVTVEMPVSKCHFTVTLSWETVWESCRIVGA